MGSKSAERFAFNLLNWNPSQLHEMADVMREIHAKLKYCAGCGCLREVDTCAFCESPLRLPDVLCVVASARDVFAIESTHEYKGLYHVLGGVLSPMDGKGPDKLSIDQLKKRIARASIQEVVIALDSTLEGDATALYLKRELEPFGVQVSRLAFGLPMGSSLDYIDGGTLARALIGRNRTW